MKQIIKFSLAILMMALCSIPVNAQNSQPQSNQHQRMSREQLAKAQANYIARQLALDDATADKFVSTYCDCVKEFWALGPRVKQNRKSGNTRFERSQKILALREKYYKRYSTFLTQKQIQRVYEMERQMMRRLSQKSGKGARGGQGRKQMRQY